MSIAKGTVQTRVIGTVPLVKLSRSILERQVHIGKNVIEKRTRKKEVSAHNLFRLQFFRSGLFAEKFLDRTSRRDPSQQLEPISATDTLPRRIKCQLTELLSIKII